MNGLSLRINRIGAKKSKNSIAFAPVELPKHLHENFDGGTEFKNFLSSASADEQLTILKKILDASRDSFDGDTVDFLVTVFWQAEAKHPVKCFLTRHITRNNNIQESFSEALASQITNCTKMEHMDHKQYIDIVTKLAPCIENFPAGVAAVKTVEISLAVYLRNCLECCVSTLRNTKSLSPTEKNEIFNLAHLSLRLLLYIVQKITTTNISILIPMLPTIRVYIKELLFDSDAPMDTKSVCGILYLSMHILEHGPDSWADILSNKGVDKKCDGLLSDESGQLSLYSAIATVVPAERLQAHLIDDQPGILQLTTEILFIGERSSSESIFILGVTRTLLQISKMLHKVSDSALGQRLVDKVLSFVWTHLDHYMDSVRHLTAQMLTCVVKYCTKLNREGDDKALTCVFCAVTSLDRDRKSYYLGVGSLAAELGARDVTRRMPGLVLRLVHALHVQPVQASATTALELLLQKHIQESSTETIHKQWIEPILSYVEEHTLETGVLNILENVLAMAVKLDDNLINYILPYIKRTCENVSTSKDVPLKCTLMLLSVARKSGVTTKLSCEQNDEYWKGIISYEVLKMASADAVDETRILSLSLVSESPRSTEPLSEGELSVVLNFLTLNINAQAPNFRQQVLSLIKKLMKRVEDSYKVFSREHKGEDYYLTFVEELRELCMDSLMCGANYTRRCVALQVLAWGQHLHVPGDRIWKEEYVDKLLLHLEDSYENNKALALEILAKCPTELLKRNSYSISLDIEDIFRQASSVKPTDCSSAAYKLRLLTMKLPEYVLQGIDPDVRPECVTYVLLGRLLGVLQAELAVCRRSVVEAASKAPMYGILHCINMHLLQHVDATAISTSNDWKQLIGEIITTCIDVSASVACVVNNSSPEGHLPMDMSGVAVTDHGNTGGVKLEDGRQVTAQMVLLCAWRSVKEVSLLLGGICSRLSIVGEQAEGGSITQQQVLVVGQHLTSLLAETKHRGAFEQAYVGFTMLLARLWRCRSAELHSVPCGWLSELVAHVADPSSTGLCATRRSAGLPFMIQALVTTELQVQGNGKGFSWCMQQLLSLARGSAEARTRAHALNILRALVRHSALQDSVAAYVGDAFTAALDGFQRDTWMERNSSTLLFSALMTRVFGVQRSKDTDVLSLRNRMTGRIFFLRYPHLYDYMLEKLKEASSSEGSQVLRPSLYPILLLLARLYPSSLEGTVSNLKLVAFIPHVLSCCGSRVLNTRQLAAKAMVPLISPEQYIPHLEAMLSLLCDRTIKRNYCHGILLQLSRLLGARGEEAAHARLGRLVPRTSWMLQQARGRAPCYLLADEYLSVVNLLIWRFPTLIQNDFVKKLEACLEDLLFSASDPPVITSGRDICLANALYLYLVISMKYNQTNAWNIIYNGLSHTSYEVILATLNCLLLLYNSIEAENKYLQHLATIPKHDILDKKDIKYIQLLCNILKNNKYLECLQKTLKLLTLEDNTQKYIVEIKSNEKALNNEMIIEKLFECIQNEHENLMHVYLESLVKFVTGLLRENKLNGSMLVKVLRVVFACSSSDNNESTRSAAVGFLENNFETLLQLNLDGMTAEEKFEYHCTVFATTITLLEDDEEYLRQRVSNAVCRHCGWPTVLPNKSAHLLEHLIEKRPDNVAVFVAIALLDFKSEVCMTDDGNDECRVFDQNERYNTFLEETVWSSKCADKILQIHHTSNTNTKVIDHVASIVDDPVYKETLDKLCSNNLVIFKNILNNGFVRNNDVNPKIELFVKRLCK